MSALLPGEAEIRINGEPRRLRLTLGALAEIEETVGEGDFETLRARLANPRISDLLLILHALIAGGGERLALDVIRASDIDFPLAARAIGKAFRSLGAASSRDALLHPSPVHGRGAGGEGKPHARSLQSALTPNPSPAGGRGEKSVHGEMPPKKPRARRSPGRSGSAPESSR